MTTLLLVSVLQDAPAAVPTPMAQASLIQMETARAILAALHAGRAVVPAAHLGGFDLLIDNLERALGEPHAATLRALVGEERRVLMRYDLHVFCDRQGHARARCILDGVTLAEIDLRDTELDVVSGIAQRAAFAAAAAREGQDPP
jgi:hypothetical protein